MSRGMERGRDQRGTDGQRAGSSRRSDPNRQLPLHCMKVDLVVLGSNLCHERSCGNTREFESRRCRRMDNVAEWLRRLPAMKHHHAFLPDLGM